MAERLRYDVRMAKDLSAHQQKIVKRYYEHRDTIRSDRLSELVAELWLCEDAAQATKLWGKAQVELMKAGVNATQAGKVAGDRDTEALAKLVKQIDAGDESPSAAATAPPAADAGSGDPAASKRAAFIDGTVPGQTKALGARSVADGRTIADMRREQAAATGNDSLEEDNLKRALKAFRRKLKTMRRDDESQIRGRYTTRGQVSSIVAITPPNQFPPRCGRNSPVRVGSRRRGRARTNCRRRPTIGLDSEAAHVYATHFQTTRVSKPVRGGDPRVSVGLRPDADVRRAAPAR